MIVFTIYMFTTTWGWVPTQSFSTQTACMAELQPYLDQMYVGACRRERFP